MLSPPRKAKCPFSKNGQFRLAFCTMHKTMKNNKKSIFFVMSLISVKRSNTSCFFPNTTFNFQYLLEMFELRNEVGPPYFSMISSNTCFCVSIAFRICSFSSLASLKVRGWQNPRSFVCSAFDCEASYSIHLSGFSKCCWHWSKTMQSGLFTGNPPWPRPD